MDFGNKIEELKELDLISQVERFSDENTESGVDCTLRLGLPNNEPEPEPSLLSMKPKPAVTLPTINAQSRPSEVTGNSRMINRIATAYSTTFPWIPKLVNFKDSIGGIGFDGNHPSMAIPCIGSSNGSGVNGSRPTIAIPGTEDSSITSQNYGRHPDVLKSQDNVAVSNVQKKNGKFKIPNVRKCLVCQTTTSSLWRNGPMGNKTLCNPCGLQHKKEVWLASLMESKKNKVNEASASNPQKKPKI